VCESACGTAPQNSTYPVVLIRGATSVRGSSIC
jgi:hypothetical protein